MYETLLDLISEHRADFYELLILNHKAILSECDKRSKQVVANELGMKPPKFTHIYSMLEAYSRLQLQAKA